MRYVRSTKEPVLAVVQGPSPHGEQYRTITYKMGQNVCGEPGGWGTPLGTSCISPGTSRRQSGSPKSWKLQQLLNLHRNLQPNVESRLQQSLLQPVHPSLSLMGNMCSCSRLCGTARGSFTLSLYRTRGMHRTDEWMLCIENSAYLYCVHGMTGHEFCRVCAGKWFVGSGVQPPPGGGGPSFGDCPPRGGGGPSSLGGGGWT